MIAACMDAAFTLARQGRAQASPNPMVGAVVAREGEIIGRGYHTYAGLKHAEVAALEDAGERALGADLYVTLEPCAHQGRTPPCVDAVSAAGIARVFYAIDDPNPNVAGGGAEKLRAAGIKAERVDQYGAEARKLNEPFFHFSASGRPLVTLKAAITLDGKISAPDDNSGWITSEKARAHVQEMRHDHDAIMTGIGTVLADDCLLTDRTGLPRSRPLLRVIMDSQLRLPLDSQMVRSANGDVAAITTSAASPERRAALENRGVKVVVCDGRGGRANFQAAVEWLGRERYLSLMVEAGSKLNWTALESECVDRVFFYYGPKILGGLEALPLAGGIGRRRRSDAIRIHDISIHPIPPDEFAVEGYLHVHRDY
jgi:diaminohydroxyphosphoribosylaminopyrimidine deaminase/5-amino-6-(5-phosphoribosylamino)uracil reductase